MKDVAYNLLMNANVALNKRTNQLIISRRDRLVAFIAKLGFTTDQALSSVKIEINNSWSNPPNPASVKEKMLLGGATYKYQVWAVVRGVGK